MSDQLPEPNLGDPDVIRYWMDSDDAGGKLTYDAIAAYEQANDEGKAAIDRMLLAVCGFKFSNADAHGIRAGIRLHDGRGQRGPAGRGKAIGRGVVTRAVCEGR
jgi:hypothetical protein